jgi:serine/threonine protein kinase
MSQSGSEGCVIIPSLKNENNKGYVTKLFYNEDSKKKEILALELFKSSHLDDAEEYTITSYDETPITLPNDITKRCRGEVSGLFINYRYGGVTLQSILDNPKDVIQLKSVIKSLIPISSFLNTINSKGYYHSDLHSANIVYDDITKKSHIIDFGNFTKKLDTTLTDDFTFGGSDGIFRIINKLVNVLITKFGDDEINISENEHKTYVNFLALKGGNSRQKMADAIALLGTIGGKRRKTKRSKRKTRKTVKK